jgi:L-alanine-DL-glutamate epimerase-like enolase superfamily enzyme
MGYPAFKIHGWGGSDESRDLDRETATVHPVGERVGDELDLMLGVSVDWDYVEARETDRRTFARCPAG